LPGSDGTYSGPTGTYYCGLISCIDGKEMGLIKFLKGRYNGMLEKENGKKKYKD